MSEAGPEQPNLGDWDPDQDLIQFKLPEDLPDAPNNWVKLGTLYDILGYEGATELFERTKRYEISRKRTLHRLIDGSL